MSGPPASSGRVTGSRVSLRDRAVAYAVIAVATLACRLPEGLTWRLATLAGSVSYRMSPERRDLARRNLRRIVEWMAENGVGDERFRRAAANRRALEALVRSAFRNHALYYLEMARTPLVNSRFIAERLLVETPDVVAEAFGTRRALIVLGAHFGAIEMPGLFVVSWLGEVVAPMESVDNPIIQRFLVRTRGKVGVRIVDLEHGAAELAAALRRDEPVGLVADRDINHTGAPVEFFGATARLPRGPALLAVESGAPVFLGSVRRAGMARYRGHLAPVPVPTQGTRRERMHAFLDAEARAFEQTIALAPDQWWAVFTPIWADLVEAPAGERAAGSSAGPSIPNLPAVGEASAPDPAAASDASTPDADPAATPEASAPEAEPAPAGEPAAASAPPRGGTSS